MNPVPCRKCRAEALTIATAHGWRIECSVHPGIHFGPECRGRDRAVREWDRLQREANDENP